MYNKLCSQRSKWGSGRSVFWKCFPSLQTLSQPCFFNGVSSTFLKTRVLSRPCRWWPNNNSRWRTHRTLRFQKMMTSWTGTSPAGTMQPTCSMGASLTHTKSPSLTYHKSKLASLRFMFLLFFSAYQWWKCWCKFCYTPPALLKVQLKVQRSFCGE